MLRRCCHRDAYTSYRAADIPTDIPERQSEPLNSVLSIFRNGANFELRHTFSKTGSVRTVQRNTEKRLRNHRYRGKTPIIITYSECMFVALGYPACKAHAPYYIVICGLPRSTIFPPHYLINGTTFGKKKLLNTKCVFRFSVQILSETFLIPRRIQRDITINVHTGCPRRYVPDFGRVFLMLTLRRLMSYIYGAPILDVSRSHTTTQHSR